MRQLRQQGGRFTRENLGDWLWDDLGHGLADQERFLTMMLGCGICFRTRKLSEEPEVWQYAAPDHLPNLEEFRKEHPNLRLPSAETATTAVSVSFRFLHDGLLRTLLARIGGIGQNAPDYWKYGCFFYVQGGETCVRFDSTNTSEGPSAAGSITFSAWGEQGTAILQKLLVEVERLTPGQQLQPIWSGSSAATTVPAVVKPAEQDAGRGLERLHIEDRRVFISYPWGTRDDEGRQHEAFVDRLCNAVKSWGYDLIRDRQQMKPGDSIRQFMDRGAAPRVWCCC